MSIDEQATSMFRELMPFTAALEIEVVSQSQEEIVSRFAWAPSRCTTGGALHGGALMSLADSTAATLAFLNLPEGSQGTTTIESKTNFFRAVKEGMLVGRSRPVHVGRRTIGVQTEVRNAEDKLVSLTFQTQAVLT
jgi:1,4-dihydroxy-2-naphthoyl-CoA hydrolase